MPDAPPILAQLVQLPSSLAVHPDLIQSIKALMVTAERTFASGTGAQKKAWVIRAALTLADAVDIPIVPNVIEEPLKALVIDAAVELLWKLFFDHRTPVAAAAAA